MDHTTDQLRQRVDDQNNEIQRLRGEVDALRASASPNAPDPPLFNGNTPGEFRNWFILLSAKLRLDNQKYDTDERRVLYAISRLANPSAILDADAFRTSLDPIYLRDYFTLVELLKDKYDQRYKWF